jgi:two-component system cell cycle sensor histidine kinase/response regulator CckA
VSNHIRLLLIEDNEDDAILLERVIRKGGYDLEIKRICTADALDQALHDEKWDAVLCDYMMPDLSVKDAMDVIRKNGLDLPFIIVSGTISDETAVEMMKAGAHDYLTKNNLSRLLPALDREINEAEQRRKRRETEERLKESERRHRMLVESITDTVLVLTSDGMISEFYSQTPISEKLSIPDHLGKSVDTIFPPIIAQKIRHLLETTLQKNLATSFEYPLGGKWYYARVNPHEDGQRIVIVSRDVTDLKEAEEAARQSHSIAMLFQDITGHDIRNLLQAIMIASDLLYADETDQSKKSLLHHVTESVNQASEIISSVQSTAALLSTSLEKTSLDFSLKSCIEAFQEQHNDVDVSTDIEVTTATINADRYLCHMLMNIMSNAIKHNTNDEKKMWAQLVERANGYELTISDNGPGIKDLMKKNLLNPERRSGGVGILQCLQIVRKYSGTFEILDRIDGDWSQGTKIRIWLPKANA